MMECINVIYILIFKLTDIDLDFSRISAPN
jgi:hypothetical protein